MTRADDELCQSSMREAHEPRQLHRRRGRDGMGQTEHLAEEVAREGGLVLLEVVEGELELCDRLLHLPAIYIGKVVAICVGQGQRTCLS